MDPITKLRKKYDLDLEWFEKSNPDLLLTWTLVWPGNKI